MDETPLTADSDEDESLDGCDVEIENPTSDEDLPPTKGGVG